MDTIRRLTDAQHSTLDRLAEKQPDTRVVGWLDDTRGRGPVLVAPTGEKRLLNHTGRVNKLRHADA